MKEEFRETVLLRPVLDERKALPKIIGCLLPLLHDLLCGRKQRRGPVPWQDECLVSVLEGEISVDQSMGGPTFESWLCHLLIAL